MIDISEKYSIYNIIFDPKTGQFLLPVQIHILFSIHLLRIVFRGKLKVLASDFKTVACIRCSQHCMDQMVPIALNTTDLLPINLKIKISTYKNELL